MTLLCLGVMLLAWRTSLQGDFQFDDYGGIVHNRHIRSVWNGSVFRESNRPFGEWTFAANYAAGGLDRAGYHAVNLLIHLLNAFLLAVGVSLTARLPQPNRIERRTALFLGLACGLLWGVHPLTTQSVTYIVQRFEQLAALGYLLAWVSLLLVVRGHRWANLLMLVAAWVGLLSKETMATAPLTLILFDRFWIAGSWMELAGKRWLTYALLLSPWLWFVPSVSRWFDPERHTSMGLGLRSVTPWQYLRTQPEILLRYVRLVLWPSDLTFDYGWCVQHDPVVYLSRGAVIVLALAVGVWWTLRRRIAGILLLAFFLLLAPTSSLMPIADLAVEHRMYLPSAVVVSGIVLLAAWGVGRAERLPIAPRTALRMAIGGLFFVTVAGCCWRTDLRNRDYRDGLVLWTRNLETRPDNARAHYMLGAEWYGRGESQKAFHEFQLARERWFGEPSALVHVGLGDCHRESGQDDQALECYRRAIAMGLPAAAGPAHNGIGVILHRRGQLDEAREAFAAGSRHGLPEARYNLAGVLIDQGREFEAIPELETILVEHPQFVRAPRRLAWILSTSTDETLRDGPRAVTLVEERCRLAPSTSPYLWDTLAAAYAETGRFADALKAAEHAEDLARSLPDPRLVAAIASRRSLYRAGKAFRDERPGPEDASPPLSGDVSDSESPSRSGERS